MLIKSADDKAKRLRLLEDLQQSPHLDARQKEWLAKELKNTRTGMRGERDAAHYIDNTLATSKYSMTLHDLRFSVDGEVAQIDHMIIGRMEFFLLETKTFGGDLKINDHGEFSVQYPGERSYGIPSPQEQSRRHENVLVKLLDRLEIKPRFGARHKFHHLVLVDPKRSIERPNAKQFDTSAVMKADQFPAWLRTYNEKEPSLAEAVTGLAMLRSTETIQDWAEKIARQHRPTNPLDLPDFMQPRAKPAKPIPAAETAPTPPQVQEPAAEHPLKRKLICATCQAKITFAEGKFCWNNPKRFGGELQYCREHQAAFP